MPYRSWKSILGADGGRIAEAVAPDSQLAAVLGEFARAMATDFPTQAILDHLVGAIVDIMPVTGAGVTLIAPDSAPRFVAASDDTALRFEQFQTELGEGPCLAAYRTGTAVLVPDLKGDQRFGRFREPALAAGLAAVFTFPLHHAGARLGALDLYRDVPGDLSGESILTAQTLADVACAYLLNAQARSDLQEVASRSHEASLHDPLTGLPNRRLLLERLEHASQRELRSQRPLTLFFVDLDRFKEVNDQHGHQAGDDLLVAIAERMTETMRPGDTIARIAGDEFVVLCEGLETPAHVDRVLVRLDAVFDAPFLLSRGKVSVSASIGTSVSAPGDTGPEDLIRRADLSMYQMKRRPHGIRNGFGVSEAVLPGETESLAGALRGALDRGEFHLDYQPIVDTRHGRLTGVEALLRWTHPSRGSVPPAVVIPLAEQLGLIGELGHWILAQAWSDRRGWHGVRAEELAVSVNVSASEFMATGFADTVASVLLNGGSDPRLLTLEVKEGVLARDSDRAIAVFKALRAMGVTLALDDFGTGKSSLSQIVSYPVDTIKIDRTFIADLAPDTAGASLVSAVVDLAHRLKMTVVSEGVETAVQYNEVARLGPDACQGYYFARPMPADGIGELLQGASDGSDTRLPVAA
jgi:diguanylate cyclase (GGDEF)-like protein